MKRYGAMFLKARQQAFGKLALGLLTVSHLQNLQNKLNAKGLKARSSFLGRLRQYEN